MTDKFKPFENETQIIITDSEYNEFTIVNHKDSITIFGTLETTKDSNEITLLLAHLNTIQKSLQKNKYSDVVEYLKPTEKMTFSKKKNNIKINIELKLNKSNTSSNIVKTFIEKITHYQNNIS